MNNKRGAMTASQRKMGQGWWILIIASIFCSKCNAQVVNSSCTPTMQDIVSNPDSQLGLMSSWLEASGYSPILDLPGWNATVFGVSDSYAAQTLKLYNEWKGPGLEAAENSTYKYLASVLLYNAIRGYYAAADLIAAGSMNTLAGEARTEDRLLSFSRNSLGQLLVQDLAESVPSRVIREIPACNGHMYILDKLLFPSNKSSQLDVLSIQSGQYAGLLMDSDKCGTSFSKFATKVTSESYVDLMKTSGLGAIIGTLDFAGTVLLPRNLSPSINASDFAAYALYNALPGAYCPNELLSLGTKNSLLGNLTDSNDPLTFKNNEKGQLTVSSSDGASTVVESYRIACNSVVLVVDELLPPPTTALRNIDASTLSAFKTLPPRRLTCNETNYADLLNSPAAKPWEIVSAAIANKNVSASSNDDVTQSNSSSNTGVLVGTIIGSIAIVAFVVALAVLYCKAKKKKSRQSTPPVVIKQYHSGTVSEVFVDGRGKIDSFRDLEIADEMFKNERALANELNTAKFEMPDTPKHSDVDLAVSARTISEIVEENPSLQSLYIHERDISIDRDEFKKLKMLGSGTYGNVYQGKLRGTIPIAGKVLIHTGIENEKAILKEAEILKCVDGTESHIVRVFGISTIASRMVLVMELMEGGDLRRMLDKDEGGLFDWKRYGKQVALDIARGLVSLHNCNIIHRDLKSKNVLLSTEGGSMVAKLGDVGVAATLSSGYLSATNNVVGTLAWSAPELLLGERCDSKVDIYSFGIVLWEIATKAVPKRGFIAMPGDSEQSPQALIDLILQCTQKSPRRRPTAKEVYERLLEI